MLVCMRHSVLGGGGCRGACTCMSSSKPTPVPACRHAWDGPEKPGRGSLSDTSLWIYVRCRCYGMHHIAVRASLGPACTLSTFMASAQLYCITRASRQEPARPSCEGTGSNVQLCIDLLASLKIESERFPVSLDSGDLPAGVVWHEGHASLTNSLMPLHFCGWCTAPLPDALA